MIFIYVIICGLKQRQLYKIKNFKNPSIFKLFFEKKPCKTDFTFMKIKNTLLFGIKIEIGVFMNMKSSRTFFQTQTTERFAEKKLGKSTISVIFSKKI